MGIIESLFSSESVINKATDAVISAGDKMIFTDEEKMDMNMKMREFHVKTLEAYRPFKLAQRVLAIWFSLMYGIAFIVGLFIAIFNMISTYKQTVAGVGKEKIVSIPLEPLFSLIDTFSVPWIILTIVSFYYGGALVSSVTGKSST